MHIDIRSRRDVDDLADDVIGDEVAVFGADLQARIVFGGQAGGGVGW